MFPRPFHIIAHRGASAQAPENTLPAFELAREAGAFEVELDVELSADDVLILFHDASLDLKTNLAGRVREHSAEELLRADIGSWFDETHPDVARRYTGTPLIRLRDLFSRFGRDLYYHVEIKAPEHAIPGLILAELAEFELQGRALLTSFDFPQLVRARELDAAIPITLLLGNAHELAEFSTPDGEPPRATLLERQKAWIDAAHSAGFQIAGIRSIDLSPEVVRYARALGLEVRAWAISNDEDMERAIALGCNGMTTNWPERLIQRLVEHMGAGGGLR